MQQSLTFPPPIIFSAAYTDLPQRGHLSTSPNFLANFEGLVGVEGRAGFGELTETEIFSTFKHCLKNHVSIFKIIFPIQYTFWKSYSIKSWDMKLDV